MTWGIPGINVGGFINWANQRYSTPVYRTFRQIGTAGASFIPGRTGDPYREQVRNVYQESRLPAPFKFAATVFGPPQTRGQASLSLALSAIPFGGFGTRPVEQAAARIGERETVQTVERAGGSSFGERVAALLGRNEVKGVERAEVGASVARAERGGAETLSGAAGALSTEEVVNAGTRTTARAAEGSFIARHPIVSVGLAAGTGLGLASLIQPNPNVTINVPPNGSGPGPDGPLPLGPQDPYPIYGPDPYAPTSQGGALDRIGGGLGELFANIGRGFDDLLAPVGEGAGSTTAKFGVLILAAVAIVIAGPTILKGIKAFGKGAGKTAAKVAKK